MNIYSCRHAVFFALIFYRAIAFVESTASRENTNVISSTQEEKQIPPIYNLEVNELGSLMHGTRDLSTQDDDEYNMRSLQIPINGHNHDGLRGESDSNTAQVNRHMYQQDDNSAGTFATIEIMPSLTMREGMIPSRTKRDVTEGNQVFDYLGGGNRYVGQKRFTDAMRLGKRGKRGGSASFVDSMRLGKRFDDLDYALWSGVAHKRYSDAMRLGKKDMMGSMRLGKRLSDQMRLGKREIFSIDGGNVDAGQKRAMADSMRLGKRLSDQMRLGKRHNGVDDDIGSHSPGYAKRMSDLMRLGKREEYNDAIAVLTPEPSMGKPELFELGKRMSDQMRLGKRPKSENSPDSPSDDSIAGTSIDEKRMADLMRLGKRTENMSLGPPKRMSDQMRQGKLKEDLYLVAEKRLSDMMRLGKRNAFDAMRLGNLRKLGKRFGDDIRYGKRTFIEDTRMGKRMGDVMRLGKRMQDAMRLGKRGEGIN